MGEHTNENDKKSTNIPGRVTRRRFVEAVGATGTAASIAGCSGNDGGGQNNQSTTSSGGGSSGKTIVKFASDSLANENADKIRQALWNAGLSKDIEVQMIAGAWDTDKRQNQYQQWLSADRADPDLLMMDSGWFQPFVARDQVMNLSKNAPKDLLNTVKNDYLKNAVRSVKSPKNGDLYGIPMFIGIPTMQYRKDLVKEAGYDPEGQNWATEPLSWKKFSKVTKDVKQNSDVDYGYTFQADAYEGLSCCDFNEFMGSWGGSYFGSLDNLFGPIGDRPVTVDEKPVIKAIRMVRTFINGSNDPKSLDGFAGNIAPKGVLQWNEPTSLKPFSNKNAVMHRNWPFAIKEAGAKKALGKDLGTMPIPYGVKSSEAKYEGMGGSVSALGGWNLAVNPNSKNKEAAMEVVKAFANDDVMLELFTLIGWMPPKPNLLTSKKAKQIPILGRYMDTIQVAAKNAVPRPATAVWPPQSSKISQHVHACFTQKEQPKPSMKKLKKQIEAIEKKA